MRKTLLLQTALVAAAGLMLADAASAQDKAVPIGVTVGGYMTRSFSIQDRGARQVDQPAQTFAAPDAEIWFNIRSVLDNGTVVGGRIELEGSTESDQIDESYLFVERRDIGRVELGSTDLVPNKMTYGTPNAIPGDSTTTVGSVGDFFGSDQYRLRFSAIPDDKEHINLYTSANRYFGSKAGKGLQLGFSYLPNACEDRGTSAGTTGSCQTFSGAANGSTVNNMQNVYAAAANYIESFGPVDAALFTGWYQGRPGSASNPNGDTLQGYQGGVNLAYNVGDGSQVQLGGMYTQEELDTISANKHGWSGGLKYLTSGSKPGSVGIGVEGRKVRVTNVSASAGGNGQGSDETLYMLGVTYQVATGILTFAGVGNEKVEYDTAGISDNKQTFGTVGIRLDF
ncbi:porin [Ferrovibrio xuzhouensis]|uniref:Porin n=1 Tax=Ferrovibrio xuzhouensis TaxID=1576914 RepID=A0ABV7VCF5_9PROT